MDETVFVILLLTGVPSASTQNSYYFVRNSMTWDEAQIHCMEEYIDLAQTHSMADITAMMNIPTDGYTDEAWIGLFGSTSEWTWTDGQPATYANWNDGQPNYLHSDQCVTIDDDGKWYNNNCSERREYVCSDGSSSAHSGSVNSDRDGSEVTWYGALNRCEKDESTLVKIPDSVTNVRVQATLSTGTKAWIGLKKPKFWYLSETDEVSTFVNWKAGQPDNSTGEEGCAAMLLKSGTWVEKLCDTKYPFFCFGVGKTRKTTVRMRIESSANLEDPVSSAKLQQQLHAALARQGRTDVRLTWRKLPVKNKTGN